MFYRDRMLLDGLCPAGSESCFTEIVLYYQPGRDTIKPSIHDQPGRELTRAEWQQCVALVNAWYRSCHVTDEEMIAANERWAETQSAMPSTESRLRQREGWIYIIQGDRFYKIGQAVVISTRLQQFTPQLPFETELVHSFPVDDMTSAEQTLHKMFAEKKTNGEWFALSDDDVTWLKSIKGLVNVK